MNVDKQKLIELMNVMTEKVRAYDSSLGITIQTSPRGNLDFHIVYPNGMIYQTFEMDFSDEEYPMWYVVRHTYEK